MVSVLGWIFKRQKSKSPSISQEVMNTNKLLIKKIGHLVDIIKDQESFNSKNTFINSYQEFLEFDSVFTSLSEFIFVPEKKKKY